MSEVVFSVTQEADGGFVAEGLGYDIITQADDWESLRTSVSEAVNAYFFDQAKPDRSAGAAPLLSIADLIDRSCGGADAAV